VPRGVLLAGLTVARLFSTVAHALTGTAEA
jgi:hypothetical protein